MEITIANQNWYTMYKKCLTLKGDNDNIKTTMITGSLWDETIEWLVKSGATNSEGTTLTYYLVGSDSTTWGNYLHATFKYIAKNSEKPEATENKEINKSTRIPTGSAEYTKAKNIYDMAGNVRDWTTEVNSTYNRVCRSGEYSSSGSLFTATYRNFVNSYDSMRLSRSTLYQIGIKKIKYKYKKIKIYTKFTKNKKERKKEKNDRKAEKNKIFCLIFCQ